MTSTEDQANEGLSRRSFLTLAAGTSAGLLAAACGGSSGPGASSSGGKKFTGKYTGPKVTLQYWNGFTGGDGPTMRKMVDEFNASHSNINVKMTTIVWADYYQKVPAAVQQGKGPDVGIAHVDRLAGLGARQVILPLDDVAKDLKLTESDFVAATWKAGIYKGKRYGIPLDVHSLAQYWNSGITGKAGLQALPDKRSDYEAALNKINGVFPHPFWLDAGWPDFMMWESLTWQFGGEPWGDGTKVGFDSDAGIRAMTWLVDLVNKGISPPKVAQDAQYNAFKTGKNAITWDGIWQINDLKTTAPNIKWDISFLPTIGDRPAAWASGHNFVLMKQNNPNDNKLDAAKVFISYISAKSVEWARSGMIPARNSIRDSAEFKTLPQAKVAQGVENMHFLPPVPGLGDVRDAVLGPAINKAVLKQGTPKGILGDAAKAANAQLAENRKKFGG